MLINKHFYQEEFGGEGGAAGGEIPTEAKPVVSPPKTVADINEIPALLKNQYNYDPVKNQWNFIPVDNLKNALTKERNSNAALQSENKLIQEVLKKHGLITDEDKGVPIDKLEEALSTISERLMRGNEAVKSTNEKEIIDKALTEAKKEWQGQLKAKETMINELTSKAEAYKAKLESNIVETSIASALSSVSLSDSGKQLLPLLLRTKTQLVEEDGHYDVRVLDPESSNQDTPYRVNKEGKYMTVLEYISGPLRDDFPDLYYVGAGSPASGVFSSSKQSYQSSSATQTGRGLSNVKDGTWHVSQDEYFSLMQRHKNGERNAYSEALRLGLDIRF